MLTYDDNATIRHAIIKRIDKEPNVAIADINMLNQPDAKPPHIQVGVWWFLKDSIQDAGLIDGRSFFDLPAEFEHRQLLNEIDEIAEQIKAVRRETTVGRLLWAPGKQQPRKAVAGRGLRGTWPS